MKTPTAWLLASLLALGGCAPLMLQEAGRSDRPAARVPPEYRPPAGKCRIWYPDRTPQRQPPVGECRTLRGQVPQGAVLIRG